VTHGRTHCPTAVQPEHAAAMADQSDLKLMQRDIAAGLIDLHPTNRDYRHSLALGYTHVGEVHGALRHPGLALSSIEKALVIERKIVAADPGVPSSRSRLADTVRRHTTAVRPASPGRVGLPPVDRNSSPGCLGRRYSLSGSPAGRDEHADSGPPSTV